MFPLASNIAPSIDMSMPLVSASAHCKHDAATMKWMKELNMVVSLLSDDDEEQDEWKCYDGQCVGGFT
jgi:hypothetical protein